MLPVKQMQSTLQLTIVHKVKTLSAIIIILTWVIKVTSGHKEVLPVNRHFHWELYNTVTLLALCKTLVSKVMVSEQLDTRAGRYGLQIKSQIFSYHIRFSILIKFFVVVVVVFCCKLQKTKELFQIHCFYFKETWISLLGI